MADPEWRALDPRMERPRLKPGKIETPYDDPVTIRDRLTYPSLRVAYLAGWNAGSRATVDNLANLGWEFHK